MQIHKVIGSSPAMHQRGFQLKEKYPVSIFMKFSPEYVFQGNAFVSQVYYTTQISMKLFIQLAT